MAIYEEEFPSDPIGEISFNEENEFYNLVQIKSTVSDLLEILLRGHKNFIVWNQSYREDGDIILVAFEDRSRACIDDPLIFKLNSSHLKDFNERCKRFDMVLIHIMLLDDPSMRTFLDNRVFQYE